MSGVCCVCVFVRRRYTFSFPLACLLINVGLCNEEAVFGNMITKPLNMFGARMLAPFPAASLGFAAIAALLTTLASGLVKDH